MVKRWLITGGRGFIGTNLRIALRKKFVKDKVATVDNLTHDTGYDEGIKRFKSYEIDVANWVAMSDIFHIVKPHYLVHLAGSTEVRKSAGSPMECFETNFLGTLTCLELCKDFGIEKVIVASSCGVVGDQFMTVDENMSFYPQSPYSASKACAEIVSDSYLKMGVNVAILRFTNVYGPWSLHKNSIIAKFIKCHLDGKAFTIYGDGNQTRNFIYVMDAVKAIIAAAKSNQRGVFCIGGSKSYSINDFIEMFNRKYKKGIKCRYSKADENEVKNIEVNTKKARLELRFQPDYSFLDGIDKTYQWYRENYNADGV